MLSTQGLLSSTSSSSLFSCTELAGVVEALTAGILTSGIWCLKIEEKRVNFGYVLTHSMSISHQETFNVSLVPEDTQRFMMS